MDGHDSGVEQCAIDSSLWPTLELEYYWAEIQCGRPGRYKTIREILAEWLTWEHHLPPVSEALLTRIWRSARQDGEQQVEEQARALLRQMRPFTRWVAVTLQQLLRPFALNSPSTFALLGNDFASSHPCKKKWVLRRICG